MVAVVGPAVQRHGEDLALLELLEHSCRADPSEQSRRRASRSDGRALRCRRGTGGARRGGRRGHCGPGTRPPSAISWPSRPGPGCAWPGSCRSSPGRTTADRPPSPRFAGPTGPGRLLGAARRRSPGRAARLPRSESAGSPPQSRAGRRTREGVTGSTLVADGWRQPGGRSAAGSGPVARGQLRPASPRSNGRRRRRSGHARPPRSRGRARHRGHGPTHLRATARTPPCNWLRDERSGFPRPRRPARRGTTQPARRPTWRSEREASSCPTPQAPLSGQSADSRRRRAMPVKRSREMPLAAGTRSLAATMSPFLRGYVRPFCGIYGSDPVRCTPVVPQYCQLLADNPMQMSQVAALSQPNRLSRPRTLGPTRSHARDQGCLARISPVEPLR